MITLPLRYDLHVTQGGALSADIPIASWDLDLTGYTLAAVARISPGETTAAVVFATATTPIAVDVSSGANHIAVRLTATETAEIDPARYSWDVFGTKSGTKTHLVTGTFSVIGGVTR